MLFCAEYGKQRAEFCVILNIIFQLNIDDKDLDVNVCFDYVLVISICGIYLSGETPPYHYGTHYSSAMIVASYLVRMEPFTQHFLSLQVRSKFKPRFIISERLMV